MAIHDGPLTSMALCWRLERPDGAGIGLTSHDRQIVVDGLIHEPAPGITPAAIIRTLGLEPQSGEVEGALSSDALDSEDLSLGRWNGSAISLRAVDWRSPSSQAVTLMSGTLGEVNLNGEEFSAELRGVAVELDRPVCPATSAECRANFGDAACRVDLAGRTVTLEINAAVDGELTLGQSIDERYLFGRLRFLDGRNCGFSTIVLAVDGPRVRIRDLARAEINPGERVELREGCDKRFETCCVRFDNAINFRGEPHLPGGDLLTRYPGA